MVKPQPGTFPPYFQNYISLVEADSVQQAIKKYTEPIVAFFKTIPENKAGFRYSEGKWTIKELVQHIIDAERIFAYRALCIARKDQSSFPGFDENSYAIASNANARNLKDLIDEFVAVRKSTNLLFKSFTDEQLQQSGTTNGQPNTVVAIAFITFGHVLHHKKILEERYL